MATSGASSISRIQTLKAIYQISNVLQPSKNFSRMLNLTGTKMFEELQNNPKKLVYCEINDRYVLQYKIPPYSFHEQRKNQEFPLSMFLGVIDVTTTWALMLHAKEKSQDIRAGLSLQLYTQLCSARGLGLHVGDDVDIVIKVVKMGRILGVANVEIKKRETGDLVCIARHNKYLPTDFLTRMALGRLFPIAKYIASLYASNHIPLTSSEEINLEQKDSTNVNNPTEAIELKNVLLWESISHDAARASFLVTPNHLNELGSLHGGCQSAVMEKIGEIYLTRDDLEKQCEAGMWRLKSINISYHSTAKQSSAVIAEIVNVFHEESLYECSMVVQIMKKKDSKNLILSEGILHWNRKELERKSH